MACSILQWSYFLSITPTCFLGGWQKMDSQSGWSWRSANCTCREYKFVGLRHTARLTRLTSSCDTGELYLTSKHQRRSPRSRRKVCQTYCSSAGILREPKAWRAMSLWSLVVPCSTQALLFRVALMCGQSIDITTGLQSSKELARSDGLFISLYSVTGGHKKLASVLLLFLSKCHLPHHPWGYRENLSI